MSKRNTVSSDQIPLPFSWGTVEQDRASKERLSMRIGWLVGVLKAGLHDYDRYLVDRDIIHKVAAMKNHKYALIDGELYSVEIAKNHIRWAEKWGAQKWEIEQEIERLRVMLAEYD